MNSLLLNAAIDWLKGVVSAASSTDDNSAIVDMSGYESAVFMTTITDSVDTGVATLTIEQNSVNSASGMAAITGAAATVTSAENDDLNNKLLIVEVVKPQQRYLQAVRTSATANIAFGDVICIRHRKRVTPASQSSSTVAASTSVVGS